MAIVYPNATEILWLKHLVGVELPNFQTLKLFTNDFTPDDNSFDDASGSSFVEASGGGYAAIPLDSGLWVFATVSGKGTSTFPDQTFSFTGPLDAGATVYGWYMVKRFGNGDTNGGLLATDRFDTPFTPAANGDSRTFGIQLTLRDP